MADDSVVHIRTTEGVYLGTVDITETGLTRISVFGGIPVWGHGTSQGDMDGIYSVTSARTESVAYLAEYYEKRIVEARKAYGDPKLPRPMSVKDAERL